MEKPSVTLTYETGCATGMLFSGFAAFILFMNAVSPTVSDGSVMPWAIAGIMGLLAVFFFLLGASSQTLDEHGIRIKTPIFTKQFAWSDVKRVELRKDRGRGGGEVPLMTMDLKGWVPGWTIPYAKRVMACIRYYYGEPDIDTWGKPPTSF